MTMYCMNSPAKGQWRGALMFSLILAWINTWVNNRKAGDLRRHCTHCDVIVMKHIIPIENHEQQYLIQNHQRSDVQKRDVYGLMYILTQYKLQ